MFKKYFPFIREKLLKKYRLVIMNDITFEEKVVLRLSRLNVIIFFSALSFILIVATALIIAFTPLREYIPGYSNIEDRRKLYKLTQSADSLNYLLSITNEYLDSLMFVLSDAQNIHQINTQELDEITSKNVSSSENVQTKNLRKRIFFYKPVEGVVTQQFLPAVNHLGIDVVTNVNSPVLAIDDGTVVMARWSYQFGNILIIQHPNNIISVYKHNSLLLKKEGDRVKGGEVVSISGNTGEITTGPHLHIELWMNGVPVNPALFLNYATKN